MQAAAAAERRAARLQELEQKIRDELPEAVRQVLRLTQVLNSAPEDRERECRQELALAAHRLRGRAASLQLSVLCAAAGAVERLSATSASPVTLGAAAASCERALAGAPTP